MSAWSEFYAPRMNERYPDNFKKKYLLFIELLEEQIRKGANQVEEHGAGIGTVTKHLLNSDDRANHLLLDNDKDVMKLGRENLNHPRASFILHDIKMPLALPADLIHSHGVLEHMNDKEIKETVKNQILRCNTVIHYVPSSKYTERSFGDERLLSPHTWQNLVDPDTIISFNDEHDLILCWGLK